MKTRKTLSLKWTSLTNQVALFFNGVMYVTLSSNSLESPGESESQLELIEDIKYDKACLKKVSGGGFSEIYQVEATFKLKHAKNNPLYNFNKNNDIFSYAIALKKLKG